RERMVAAAPFGDARVDLVRRQLHPARLPEGAGPGGARSHPYRRLRRRECRHHRQQAEAVDLGGRRLDTERITQLLTEHLVTTAHAEHRSPGPRGVADGLGETG